MILVLFKFLAIGQKLAALYADKFLTIEAMSR